MAVLIAAFVLYAGAIQGKQVTEGVITHDFIAERQMKEGMLQMLADFTSYMKANWQPIEDRNSEGYPLGVFKERTPWGATSRECGITPTFP